MHLLTEWEGHTGKIFGSRSWRIDRAQQIFYRQDLLNSANMYFMCVHAE